MMLKKQVLLFTSKLSIIEWGDRVAIGAVSIWRKASVHAISNDR